MSEQSAPRPYNPDYDEVLDNFNVGQIEVFGWDTLVKCIGDFAYDSAIQDLAEGLRGVYKKEVVARGLQYGQLVTFQRYHRKPLMLVAGASQVALRNVSQYFFYTEVQGDRKRRWPYYEGVTIPDVGNTEPHYWRELNRRRPMLPRDFFPHIHTAQRPITNADITLIEAEVSAARSDHAAHQLEAAYNNSPDQNANDPAQPIVPWL